MAELTTVPTFIFEQGEVTEGGEFPIQVKYWDNGETIELNQRGNEIILNEKFVKSLAKEIMKHLPEAKKKLSK